MLISFRIAIFEQIPVLSRIFLDLNGQFLQFLIDHLDMRFKFFFRFRCLKRLAVFAVGICMFEGGLVGRFLDCFSIFTFLFSFILGYLTSPVRQVILEGCGFRIVRFS